MRLLSFVVLFAAILTVSSRANAAPVPVANYTEPIKVACVGDSITAGYGVGQDWSWSAQVSRMLGNNWEVHSFGVSGATMLKKSDNSYWNHKEYPAALALNPDVVIVELGTNDTKPGNWNADAFVADCQEMLNAFLALPKKPLIYLCLPVPVTPPGNFTIPPACSEMITPLIHQLAEKNGCGLIDFTSVVTPHPEWLPDHVHPEPAGGFAMAKAAYAVLTGADYSGGVLLTTQGPHPRPKPVAPPAPATNAAPAQPTPAVSPVPAAK
jgi:lysophospholipase L1-like esterase